MRKTDKRKFNGRHPNSHINAGRKAKYVGESKRITFRTTAQAILKLEAEAARQDLNRNELFNKWLNDLPEYRPD